MKEAACCLRQCRFEAPQSRQLVAAAQCPQHAAIAQPTLWTMMTLQTARRSTQAPFAPRHAASHRLEEQRAGQRASRRASPRGSNFEQSDLREAQRLRAAAVDEVHQAHKSEQLQGRASKHACLQPTYPSLCCAMKQVKTCAA